MRRSRVWMVLACAALVGAAFGVMVVKDRTYAGSAAYAPTGEASGEVAVVYYSRSGHSEAVAREIARGFNAQIARIEADYALNFEGQGRAIADARGEVLPKIRVEPLELGGVRCVYMVAPTWLFRPAQPLWAYVEQAELEGKQVVLVMTGNSRYEQAQIEAFGARVAARGGRLVRHEFIERGRIYWQMSREQLLASARERASAGCGAARL